MAVRLEASTPDRIDASIFFIFVGINWSDQITNAAVLIHAQLLSLYALVQEHQLC